MEITTMEKLKELINVEQECCISMFLPTFRMGVDIKQNPIRFKQRVREAEDKLVDMGMSASEVRDILKPASDLINETLFWQNQTDGLAVFISLEGMNYYHLPFTVEEYVGVAKKFYTKPLVPLFTGDGQFYILALSKNEVRLFKGTRQEVYEIEMDGAPSGMTDVMIDYDPRTKLEIRNFNSKGSLAAGASPITQAQGNENDFERNELTKYFREIDIALNNLYKGEGLPLVLAGVEYLIPIYKEISIYPHITEDFIRGNPELLSGNDLHKLAWDVIEPRFLEEQVSAEAKYNQYSGQRNKLFSNSLNKIIPQSYGGQIETLFIGEGIHQWGQFSLDTNNVVLHDEQKDGDEDLIDLACIQTISKGGTVYVVEPDKVPDGGTMAAILRY